MSAKTVAERALEQGQGIARLTPTWVPRVFCVPGRRIRLHPDDTYKLGSNRGGINERWFSSGTPADNGPLTGETEGLSHIVVEDGGEAETVLLRDAVAELKGELIGDNLWDKYGVWPIYSKFFDNQAALPIHIHHRSEHAARVGQRGKPEAYYFPHQMNNHRGAFPHTYYGLLPHVTKEQVRDALVRFVEGDNRLNELSAAYALAPGTGWNIPPGTLHAPGSLCTYEPQTASDVFAMYESVSHDQIIPEELLWKNCPEEEVGNIDYLMDVIDWDLNTDPAFKEKHFMAPLPVRDLDEMRAEGYEERWVAYKCDEFSAKELTVLPGATVTIKDGGAYGMFMLQGHGTMGVWDIETPVLIRYGQLTYDEYFVTQSAAKQGVTIVNPSKSDPVVMLKHFGPDAHDNMPSFDD